MILSNTKTLDLHGESADIARVLVLEFLDDCIKMQEEYAIIIHGIGDGILKKMVQKVLAQNKKIDQYYIDFQNVGQTIIKFKRNV